MEQRFKIMIHKTGPTVSLATVLCTSKALAVVDIVRLQFLKGDYIQNIENKDYNLMDKERPRHNSATAY